MNKKGSNIIQMFIFVFVAFFIAVFLGIALLSFNLIDDALDQDVEMGQVNLADINDLTFGKINLGFVANADTIGIIILLGMCLLMILNGYFFGSKYPKFFLALDILILVFVFMVSVYLSQVYELFIDSAALFDLFKDDIPKTSKFILNLPAIIGTLGALIMIVSYSGLKKQEQNRRADFYGY